ncbi:protein of unknown function [Filimonas lacunae]|uniref:DUF4274 domain-containing protein n=1 Tax=Filimonas lacunae TaxID=477680 RepID=A0A173MD63_9BACT|nr:DUF4274 domain-containing protein [Filimonas lacunae]BAV05460.1 hypothetical protein FLA_1467 [Filimonas lacunae]SIT21001.1 protein of unknown function [Filimonas lacunae]
MKKQITEEQLDAMISERVVAFAEKGNPRLWHQMAMEWNWDSDSPFLHWLIDNPATDKGTVLMIYWRFGPRYWCQYTNKEDALGHTSLVKGYETVNYIEAKYLSGFYPNACFAFDPNVEDESGTIWAKEYLDIPAVRELPAEMYRKIEGEQVEEPMGFEEGMPPELTAQLDELLELYDTDGDDEEADD